MDFIGIRYMCTHTHTYKHAMVGHTYMYIVKRTSEHTDIGISKNKGPTRRNKIEIICKFVYTEAVLLHKSDMCAIAIPALSSLHAIQNSLTMANSLYIIHCVKRRDSTVYLDTAFG